MIFNVNSLNIKIMGSIDGEIPAVWFLITSVGFIILSSIQYKNHGKSIETILGSDGNDFKPCLAQKAPKSLKSDLYALKVLFALEVLRLFRVAS